MNIAKFTVEVLFTNEVTVDERPRVAVEALARVQETLESMSVLYHGDAWHFPLERKALVRIRCNKGEA